MELTENNIKDIENIVGLKYMLRFEDGYFFVNDDLDTQFVFNSRTNGITYEKKKLLKISKPTPVPVEWLNQLSKILAGK